MKLFKNYYFLVVAIFIAMAYTSCCSVRGTSVKHYYFKTSFAEQFITNQPISAAFRDNKNQLHIYRLVNYDRILDTKNVECRHCCEDNEIERSFLYYWDRDSLPVFRVELNADKKVDYLTVEYEGYNLDSITSTVFFNGNYTFNDFRTQADSIYFKIHPMLVHLVLFKIPISD